MAAPTRLAALLLLAAVTAVVATVDMTPLCPAAVCDSGAAPCGPQLACGGHGACVAHLGRCSAACSSGGASVLGAPCFLQTGGGSVCELGACAVGANAHGYCAPPDPHAQHRFPCACRCPNDDFSALQDDTPTPAPATTAAPATTPGPTSAGGGGLTNAEIVAIVLVSAVLAILLLICIGWCCLRQTRKQARKRSDQDSDNMGIILQGTTVVTGRAPGGNGATGLF